MNSSKTLFVARRSSLSQPIYFTIHRIVHSTENSTSFPKTITILQISHPLRSIPESLPSNPPEIFSFINRTGTRLLGCIFKPNYTPGEKYKTLVKIYGGPHVQVVTNTYDLTGQLDTQMYVALGFIVVMIDNRGSDNRGLAFEGVLHRAMGTLEIEDQIDGINHLISQGVPIDPAKIGITGWSYGGYLSLMAIGQHPEIFKVAIPKCPVTMWEAYDTGYTERYMGLPSEDPFAYRMGSVLNYVKNFPNEMNRLLLVHGAQDENVHFSNTLVLVEALIAAQKPYQLLVLPRERHGCANPNSRLYLETSCALFFIDNLH